jgi:hypothetical protein
MRSVHWLFVVGVALFLSGIWFVIASARTGGDATPSAASVISSEATVKQLMIGIAAPAADFVFNAVRSESTKDGFKDIRPQNDAEWEAVGSHAAALIEVGNLLMMGNRAVDNGNWIAMSRALMDAGRDTLKAAQAQDADGLLQSGGDLAPVCDACHERYKSGNVGT